MSSVMSSMELDDLDQRYVEVFRNLHQILQRCEEYDRKRAEQGVKEIRDRESLLERHCSSEQEVRRFLEQGEAVIREMWRQYSLLTASYTNQLRPHQYVPRTLRDVSTNVWQEVRKSLEPISRDISNRLQQNHWKGRGADDYMKQLPMQLSAVTEFGQYVDAAIVGLEVPGQLQAFVFIAGMMEIASATNAIRNGMPDDPPRGQYFTACAGAGGVLKSVNRWWRDTLMTGDRSWRDTLDNHVREMTSAQIRNPAVLKGDKWPRATKDTTDIPRPSSGPVADRQSAPSGIGGADRPTDAQGVDQSDFHTDDKGGRIW